MAKYQAVNAKHGRDLDLIHELLISIYLRIGEDDDILQYMIEAFSDSETLSQANKRAYFLFMMETMIRRSSVNEIATAFLDNDIIGQAIKARSLTIDFLKKHQKELTPENKEKLQTWLKGP